MYPIGDVQDRKHEEITEVIASIASIEVSVHDRKHEEITEVIASIASIEVSVHYCKVVY